MIGWPTGWLADWLSAMLAVTSDALDLDVLCQWSVDTLVTVAMDVTGAVALATVVEMNWS